MSFPASYNYTLTRHRWNASIEPNGDGYFAPPAGAVAAIDLRSIVDQTTAGVEAGTIFCAMSPDVVLDDTHHLLGHGDLRELQSDAGMRSVWQSVTGFSPQGDTLSDLLADHLTRGSDPAGELGCKPIVPCVDGSLQISLAGHSVVWKRQFKWGLDPHTNKLRDLLRKDFGEIADRGLAGGLKDSVHHLRVLDALCEKYGVDDIREFVPTRLRAAVDRRVPHETTLSDNFDRSNENPIASPWTYFTSDADGYAQIVSNALQHTNVFRRHFGTYGSSLSSSDYTVQLVDLNTNSNSVGGPAGRMSGASHAARSCYWGYSVNSGYTTLLYKIVSGTETQLASSSSVVALGVHTNELTVNGSAIQLENITDSITISATDTAISSGIVPGISGGQGTYLTNATFNDWSASDLAAAFKAYWRRRPVAVIGGGLI